jgi:hypothetical protein
MQWKIGLFLLTGLCYGSAVHAQSALVFPLPDSSQVFRWENIELPPDETVVDRFLKSNSIYFSAYKRKPLNTDSLRKSLHFIDINNDDRTDIVFDGESNEEGRMVRVFINTGKSYKPVFSGDQGIVKMEWQNEKLSKLYMDDWSCCGDYQRTLKIYTVTYGKTNSPVFKQVYQALTVNGAVMPDSILQKPYRITIAETGARIRTAPVEDDTSFQRWNIGQKKGSGNSFDRLPKGVKGTAVGYAKDSTGAEWFYIELDAPYRPRTYIMYLDNKFPSRMIGWVRVSATRRV